MATATLTAAEPIIVGPADDGRAMSLDDFASAQFAEGWLYELARGIIEVSEVPGIDHGMVVMALIKLFAAYGMAHPGIIQYQAAGSDCRLRLAGMQSDRHPDQAIYLTRPTRGGRLWHRWTPDLVVEVVSPGGEDRDYHAKREEYLRAGVREYWLIDLALQRLMVLVRANDVWVESVVAADGEYRPTLLPGLVVRVADLLAPVEYED